MNNAILEINNISKSFFGIKALDNVSMSIEKGCVLGLVGENGAGKSTLMNILAGIVIPDSGKITFKEKPFRPKHPKDALNAGISLIHQELNLFLNLSIADNLFIDNFQTSKFFPLINKSKLYQQTKNLLKQVELDFSPDTSLEKLSPGERQLVEIAKALGKDSDVVVFDEPTSSLTARETERLFKLIAQLKEKGKTIIYISHNLTDVINLSDYIAVLRDGKLIEVGKCKDFSIDRMVALMVSRELNQMFPNKTAVPTKNPVLEVNNLSKRGIVKDIDFSINKGEILGMFGLMGSGRTELARIIFGLDSQEDGSVMLHGKCIKKNSLRSNIKNGLAFVTEDRRLEGLMIEGSVLENMGLASLENFTKSIFKVVDKNKISDSVTKTAESLKVKYHSLEKDPVKNLSGGNQQKVVIGKWLLSNPSFIILDEPTRGIDVGAKAEIYTLIDSIAAKGTGVMFISSELEELTGMCDRILVLHKGTITAEFMRKDFNSENILRAAFGEQENGNA